ncbi:MAG: hypothetical protein ACREJQ_00210 [bacterium]
MNLTWFYATPAGEKPTYSSEGLSSEYRDIFMGRPEAAVPPIQELLNLIAEVAPRPLTVSPFGYPDVPKYDKELVNIEVILSYMSYLNLDRKTNRYGPLPNAVPSPVYMASCDPRPENKDKKDSYYEQCQAIIKHIKEKFLAPGAQTIPRNPRNSGRPCPQQRNSPTRKRQRCWTKQSSQNRGSSLIATGRSASGVAVRQN